MPSKSLLHLKTDSGWFIFEDLNNKPLGSGGNFCCRYLARSPEGRVGFLKAMDLSNAMRGGMEEIQRVVNEYMFEKEILGHCKEKGMTRVVTPLDAGEIKVPNFPDPLNTVYYLIFDKAEGDLRQRYLEQKGISWLSAFRSLHHVSVGVAQLHKASIAHQDLKPSNVLLYEQVTKVSDLGRVTDKNGRSPFGSMLFPGDRSYAPIEFCFGFQPTNFYERYSSDVYMVGSLLYHLVENIQISAVLVSEARKIIPHVLSVGYEDALPAFLSAFSNILSRYHNRCSGLFGVEIANEMRDLLLEMCNPDYKSRGNKRFSNPAMRFSMERYVGKFAELVRKAVVRGIK
jgi:serine/threonine protein kinase